MPNAPDLSIRKWHTTNIVVGDLASYAIEVRNAGGGSTTGGITVTDALPGNLELLDAGGTDWDCSATTLSEVACVHVGPLAPGARLPVLFVDVFVGWASCNGIVLNTASVATVRDFNPSNNSATDLGIASGALSSGPESLLGFASGCGTEASLDSSGSDGSGAADESPWHQ